MIDNDYDIDDLMAMPLVIADRRVAVIVQTEGYTLPAQAAPAVDALINGGSRQAGRPRIPVVVGAQQAQARDLSPWPWLPFFRAMLNRSNGLLPAPPAPWPVAADVAAVVERAVADCDRVSVLLTAPFTSFIRYAPALRPKLERVVITGLPLLQAAAQPADASFNCRFDLPACQEAVGLLAALPAQFVTLPQAPQCRRDPPPVASCFTPSHGMVAGYPGASGAGSAGLPKRGLAGRLRRALINPVQCASLYTTPATIGRPCSSLSTWEPAAVARGPGGLMWLWDQATALFLLDPQQFTAVAASGPGPAQGRPQPIGLQVQPRLPGGSHAAGARALRQLWTERSSRSAAIP